MKYFVNGRYTDRDAATIQVNDLGLIRGYAAFDFMRVVNNVPLFLDDHLDRFFHSVKVMKLNCAYSKQEIKEIAKNLIEYNKLGTSGLRLILSGGFSDYLPVKETNFFIFHEPLKLPADEIYKTGIKIQTVAFQRPVPEVKSTDYFMAVFQQQYLERPFQDILYHTGGRVTELPRANIFMVSKSGKTILTPKTNVLHGVTRKNVLQFQLDGYEIKETDFDLQELVVHSKEVFLTSSTKRILSITQIDEHIIGDGEPGKVAGKLRALLIAREAEYVQSHLKGD